MNWEQEYKRESYRFKLSSSSHEDIVVHRHIDWPGRWLYSCHAIGISRKLLEKEDLDAAQREAIADVRSIAFAILEATGGVDP